MWEPLTRTEAFSLLGLLASVLAPLIVWCLTRTAQLGDERGLLANELRAILLRGHEVGTFPPLDLAKCQRLLDLSSWWHRRRLRSAMLKYKEASKEQLDPETGILTVRKPGLATYHLEELIRLLR